MRAQSWGAEGISCGLTWVMVQGGGWGRPLGQGAEALRPAACCPLSSAVPATGPLSSGLPEGPLRLWVGVNRGLTARGHPHIGAPPLCCPCPLGLAPGWSQGP